MSTPNFPGNSVFGGVTTGPVPHLFFYDNAEVGLQAYEMGVVDTKKLFQTVGKETGPGGNGKVLLRSQKPYPGTLGSNAGTLGIMTTPRTT